MTASATQMAVERAETFGIVTGSQAVVGTHRITGQYLYDRFMNDEGERSKMDIVRYAVANITTEDFKGALKDFVAIAEKHGDATKKTAQNHQTVMRIAYGAWKFAAPQLNMLGANDKTGYQAMRVLGKQALEKAGRKWDGSKAEKVDKAIAAMDEASAMRLAEIRRDHPAEDGETPAQHELRCRALLAQEMSTEDGAKAVMQKKEVSDLAAKVEKICGDNLYDVLKRLMVSLTDTGDTGVSLGADIVQAFVDDATSKGYDVSIG